jgi:hypothetical protein
MNIGYEKGVEREREDGADSRPYCGGTLTSGTGVQRFLRQRGINAKLQWAVLVWGGGFSSNTFL